ncbi:MAG TPA: outer membrane beta-barrel protein [Bacteroidales bacterium]|nr:outer membrane beta-barrel protein [Bacteroidales bacterium]
MTGGSSQQEFDDAFRKLYENHKINPDDILWEKIDSRLHNVGLNHHVRIIKYKRFVIVSIAAAITGIVVMLAINRDIRDPHKLAEPEIIARGTVLKKKNYVISDSEISQQNIIKDSVSKNNYNKSLRKLRDQNKNISEKIKSITIEKTGVKNEQLRKTCYCSPERQSPDSTIYITDKTKQNLRMVVTEKISDILFYNYKKRNSLIERNDKNSYKIQKIKQTGHSIFAEAYAAPELSYRMLTANSKYSMPDYGKPYFNKKEKPEITYATGVNFGVRIRDVLYLKSGILYSVYSYKFKTEAKNIISDNFNGIYVYTSSGAVDLKFLSSDSLSNDSFLKSSINISYINIPLMADIYIKSNYFLDLGIDFQMLAGQNMNWQAEDYDGNFSSAISSGVNNIKKYGISLKIGFGSERQITDRLSVLINPSFRMLLSSLNNIAPVKSYPYAWSINAGVRYYFN